MPRPTVPPRPARCRPGAARLRLLGLLVALAALAPVARADEVLLQGGTRLEGVVLGRDDAGVTLLLPAGDEVWFAAFDVAKVTPDPDAPTREKTVRFVDRGEAGSSLQVSVVHLAAPAGGPRVDLIGAVHIADRAFFRDVQAHLERADVVLFEMVKPKDAAPGAVEAGPSNPIRDFQAKLATALGLVFQLDEIAYDRPHFVHADLTTEEMSGRANAGSTPAAEGDPAKGAQADRAPEMPAQLRAMLPMIAMMNGMLDRIIASTKTSERLGLKRMFARTMGTLGPRAGRLMGAEMSELLLDRRNAVVVERLREVPSGTRTVAVFYGAAHLPDLEERIVEQLGYRRLGARWVDAWRIEGPTRKAAPAPSEPREAEPAGAR